MMIRFVGMHEAVDVPSLVVSVLDDKGKPRVTKTVARGQDATVIRLANRGTPEALRATVKGLLIQESSWEAADDEAFALVAEIAAEMAAAAAGEPVYVSDEEEADNAW